MSYILDALRRAEAERERGEVPSLHTQQYAPPGDDVSRDGNARVVLWAGAGVVVALIAIVAWKWLGADLPAPAATSPVLAAAPTLPAAAPTPAATPLESVRAPAEPTVAPPPPPTVTGARSTRSGGSGSNGDERPTSTDAPDLSTRRASADIAVAKADTAAATHRIYAQAELPDDVKRGLPALNVGGASYSSDAASRMVIINGQVLHEGDKVADGLVLKQIKLRSAVLAFRSYRFEISY